MPSGEEIARKAAIKERQGQRLREMAAAKRVSRITELENELQGLEFLLQQLDSVSEHEVASFLAETGYVSKEEIESAVLRITQSLRKAKGEQLDLDEKIEPPSAEKYPLLNIPDNMLTPEQVFVVLLLLIYSYMPFILSFLVYIILTLLYILFSK